MGRANKAARVSKLLDEALALHRRGALPEAEKRYRQILRRAPGNADALHLCGIAVFQQGDAGRAEPMVVQAVARQPGNANFRHTLGEILHAQNRFDEALRTFDAALARDASRADTHYQRGNTLLALDRPAEAAEAFRLCLSLHPDDVEAMNNLANALVASGDPDSAIEVYQQAVRVSPRDAGIQTNLGQLLAERGRSDDAEIAYRNALDAEPDLVVAAINLGRLLSQNGRPEYAVALLKEQANRHPNDADALCELGQTLIALTAHGEARRLFDQVLASDPDNTEALVGTAMCLEQMGRFEEAAALQQRVIMLEPDWGAVHYELSSNRAYKVSEEHLKLLRTQLERPGVDPHARVQMRFALARFEESRGDTDAAFAAYEAANKLHSELYPFFQSMFEEHFARIEAVFDTDFFRTHKGQGADSELPVFVLGMPRSGTTLVEQIISAHPQAFGAGELSHIRRLARALPHELGSTEAFPECARELTPETARALGERYVDGLRARGPGALRVTDKLPFNFVWLGLIATLLPRAKVIHVRREPADTCLSCYFQMFEDGMRFTYDLEHLGSVYRLYDKLMTHWRAVLPLPILDVKYETLVEDQAAQSRRIIDFIGLPWDERCLQFHEAKRGVSTASFWQVRQPLYRSSLGRWRAYADHLQPLFEALGSLAPREGV